MSILLELSALRAKTQAAKPSQALGLDVDALDGHALEGLAVKVAAEAHRVALGLEDHEAGGAVQAGLVTSTSK